MDFFNVNQQRSNLKLQLSRRLDRNEIYMLQQNMNQQDDKLLGDVEKYNILKGSPMLNIDQG